LAVDAGREILYVAQEYWGYGSSEVYAFDLASHTAELFVDINSACGADSGISLGKLALRADGSVLYGSSGYKIDTTTKACVALANCGTYDPVDNRFFCPPNWIDGDDGTTTPIVMNPWSSRLAGTFVNGSSTVANGPYAIDAGRDFVVAYSPWVGALSLFDVQSGEAVILAK
jgi:hypothetical protein